MRYHTIMYQNQLCVGEIMQKAGNMDMTKSMIWLLYPRQAR